MRILIVEDEPKTGEYLRQGLTEAGYIADLVPNGSDGLHMALQGEYSLVILDVMLPGLNGWQVLQALRDRGLHMPVLFLTARDHVEDRVKGLELGADDYLVKPFHFDELFARLKVLFKRTDITDKEEKLVYEDLEIDFKQKSVNRSGITINLTSKEFTLLTLLARTPERVISKQEILEKVWDLSFDTGTNTIEVYISFLRNKIDKPFDKKLIHTKPGFGYYIK